MQLRNWIELGIAVVVFIAGTVTKHITDKKVKKIEGFRGININGEGYGWRMK